ncbi:MAG: multiheme c-type cytochrome [Planctomycetaceae bacterium]
MTVKTKQLIVGFLGLAFLASLIFVQAMEVARKNEEAGNGTAHIAIPASSKSCVECHAKSSPGIIDHWEGSTHAQKGVGCVECHQAAHEDVDAFDHYGATIATIVTPKDCGRCHKAETEEFMASHHASAGNILASLDNFLAETVEGSRTPFNPHSKTPGMEVDMVNGMASVNVGCKQCHGSKVALKGTDGSLITVDDLKPDNDGHPTNMEALALVVKDENGRPELDNSSWPNTGIGRLNLDGSRGSCSACHSRHDFSPRRARQPENCGKCHLGPDHPQKEIYEESKHGVAFRDLKHHMNLDAKDWVLGEDYTQAPTCATCHMSGHSRNGGKVTHDPAGRLSWTNRPPVSLLMDTDINGKVIKEKDAVERRKLITSSWQEKRQEMKNVCLHCHTQNYVNAFYKQYDDFVINYNEKFAKPGVSIMEALAEQKLITKTPFDEEIEWTWFYLWHHEGRRARHGASMMAPDYAHWHGMYEVAERFYQELIPQAREIAHQAEEGGKTDQAKAVLTLIDELLARPEHEWYESAKKLADEGEASVLPGSPPLAATDTDADNAKEKPDGDNADADAKNEDAAVADPAAETKDATTN